MVKSHRGQLIWENHADHPPTAHTARVRRRSLVERCWLEARPVAAMLRDRLGGLVPRYSPRSTRHQCSKSSSERRAWPRDCAARERSQERDDSEIVPVSRLWLGLGVLRLHGKPQITETPTSTMPAGVLTASGGCVALRLMRRNRNLRGCNGRRLRARTLVFRDGHDSFFESDQCFSHLRLLRREPQQ